MRLSIVALLGGTAAACSSDTGRFQDPNQSPFASAQAPAYTGSVNAAPTAAVQGAPMAAPAYGAPQPVAAAAPAYGQPAYPAPAPSYGAPQQVAMAAPAQQPLYGTTPAPVRQPAPVAAAPAPVAPAVARPAVAATGASHTVTSGQTLSSLARSYGISRSALAAANGLDPNAEVRIGQKLVIPGAAAATTAVAAATPKVMGTQPHALGTPAPTAAAPAPAAHATVAAAPAPAPAAAAPAAKPSQIAAAPLPAATSTAPAAAAAEPKAQTIAAVKPSDTPEEARTTTDGVQFRWPVRGRIISGYGPKPGGQSNEGINVSVPEGTAVKAAEDGTVAYAGSELKGYGNLVLVKHSDGWVTAYAHNSELMVKKGDTVKRGQVIAKAGQTGNVTSPQVHFEIRKGSQAVDPSRYLAGL